MYTYTYLVSLKLTEYVLFYRFPNDPFLIGSWIKAVKRTNTKDPRKHWVPGSGAAICSLHFKPTDYDQMGFLKKCSIPSIFSFTNITKERISNNSHASTTIFSLVASSSIQVPETHETELNLIILENIKLVFVYASYSLLFSENL